MHPLGIGKPLIEVVSPFTATGLLSHVSNDSPDYAIAFRHGTLVHRKQPTRLCKARAIDAAIAAMSGGIGTQGKIAFYPSWRNGFTEKSCCGGLRIPPAPGVEVAASERRVRTLLKCLRAYAYGRSIIVEACGDGSWQCWLIRPHGFSAHATWWKLLRKVTSEAGIVCEIFPSEDVFGMPAPGSWDPLTGRLSHIVYADLTAIFPEAVYSALDSFAAVAAPNTQWPK